MIFATVGAQMPFDRMIEALDGWAADRGRGDVFAQVGEALYTPRAIEWTQLIEPDEFRKRVTEASVIVAHAGMGSILTALQFGKPIVVMPRRAAFRETRNDHQVATAERFGEIDQISVAMDEGELPGLLDEVDTLARKNPDAISPHASAPLIDELRRFIHGPA